MNAAAMKAPLRRRRRWWSRPLILLLAAIALYAAFIGLRISQQSKLDETRPADVIVVFGAAEYAGKPSPVLRARVEHALTLFNGGIAPVIIATGGAGSDPKFSEGGVSRDYLVSHGVPETRVIAETVSADTWQSARRVAAIMRTNGMRTCVAVSDDYHIYRIKKMLESQGIIVYGSPRVQMKVLSTEQRVSLILREVLSYFLWRLHLR